MKSSAMHLGSLSPHAKRDLIRNRTKQLAVDVIELSRKLPNNPAVRVIRDQLLRSATSVAANYRATCRARSKREFVAKVGVLIEECDETQFWLELLEGQPQLDRALLQSLQQETNDLVSIFVASRITAENSLRSPHRQSTIGNRQ